MPLWLLARGLWQLCDLCHGLKSIYQIGGWLLLQCSTFMFNGHNISGEPCTGEGREKKSPGTRKACKQAGFDEEESRGEENKCRDKIERASSQDVGESKLHKEDRALAFFFLLQVAFAVPVAYK